MRNDEHTPLPRTIADDFKRGRSGGNRGTERIVGGYLLSKLRQRCPLPNRDEKERKKMYTLWDGLRSHRGEVLLKVI